MLNVKTWLQTTGMPVAENRFLKPPILPYMIFLETRNVDGPDDSNLIARRKLVIELYSSTINATSEKAIEDLLDAQAVSYRKERDWIESESFFQTIYETSITERK